MLDGTQKINAQPSRADTIAPAPGGGRGLLEKIGANRAVLALSFARFGDGVGNSLLFVVIPLYVADLSAPFFPFAETARAGVLLAMFGLVAGCCQPLAGALVDRFNRRKPFILGGLVLLAGATASFAFVRNFHQAMILRAIQGLGLALTIPSTLSLLTRNSHKATRGGTMGTFSTFRVSSLALGPLLGGIVHDHYGFKATFFTGAGLILSGALLVFFWVKEVRLQGERLPFKLLDRRMLASGMPALGMATFVMAGAFAMIAPLEQRINDRVSQTAAMFGLAFSALMITRILIQIPVGRLSDRRGRKKLIVAGLVLMALATAPLGWVTASWQLLALRMLQGVASGGIAAPVFALAGDLSKAGGEGRQMSIVTMGFALGISIGTLSAGVLAVFFLSLPFIAFGMLGLVAAGWVMRRVPETIGSSQY